MKLMKKMYDEGDDEMKRTILSHGMSPRRREIKDLGRLSLAINACMIT